MTMKDEVEKFAVEEDHVHIQTSEQDLEPVNQTDLGPSSVVVY